MASTERSERIEKPLGRKAYGSTPHLPGSRVGAGDHHISLGQARILTEAVRDRHDRIIVTEKLDGTCVAAARIDGKVRALIRAGYPADSSRFEMHRRFSEWVDERRERIAGILADGERVAGEWLLQAHGTRYRIGNPDDLFVGFAILRGDARLPHDEVRSRFSAAGIVGAAVLSDGPALSVADAMAMLAGGGRHGAIDPVEGAVWVCERCGEFGFIAKHVVADKVDGAYLPGIAGEIDPVWNLVPETA